MRVIKYVEYFLLLEDRSKNINKIRGMKKVIAEHCIKLYLYPDDISSNHWMKEIRSYIEKIFNTKDNNKPYDYSVYNTNLSYIKTIDYDYSDDVGFADLYDIYNNIKLDYYLEATRDDFDTFIRWYVKFIEKAIVVIQRKKFDEYEIFDLLHNIFEIEE